MKSNADVLFECSWEVCNKVGGIYTVLMSKAELMKQHYAHYFVIGPYYEHQAEVEFEQCKPPEIIARIFEELKQEGIICYFGKWQIKGEPYTILIDFGRCMHHVDEIKTQLWEHFQIEAMFSGNDFHEPMIWAWCISRILKRYAELKPGKIVGHFHEWLAGFAGLFLKSSPVRTVFTTHATMLGRTLSAHNFPLYDKLETINPHEEAKRLRVLDKFSVERACAQHSDVFTTVSEITAIEAEHILGRKPDILVLNGLDVTQFPTTEEAALIHRKSRETIRDFLDYYFLNNYYIDLDQTLLFFVVGRYEFENKGIDIIIEALGKLNKKMKENNSKKTVICFFWIPAEQHGTRTDLMEDKSTFDRIRELVEDRSESINRKIIRNIMDLNKLKHEDLFTKDFLHDIKKQVQRFKRSGNPPLSTHHVPDDDPIIRHCFANGLTNAEQDKVKIVKYPIYLTGADGLLDLTYYQAIAGCHLGLFPSRYEPWGYTPVESAAYGVPAVTTDLSGFGRFMQKRGISGKGIHIIDRFRKTRETIVTQFVNLLYTYSTFKQKDRVDQKIKARKAIELVDWKEFVKNYIEAHNLALEKE